MKKIMMAAMAALFLAAFTSMSWAQATPTVPHKRTHSRPPYSGPKKAVDVSKLKRPRFLVKPKGQHKPANVVTPSGSITVR